MRCTRTLLPAALLVLACSPLFAQQHFGALAERARQLKVEETEPLQKRAAAGDAEAQTMLGYLQTSGTLVALNPNEGLSWYRRAAEREFMAAEEGLGIFYLQGPPDLRNPSEAVRWLTRAAGHGSLPAAEALQDVYGKEDPARALAAYQAAAEAGSRDAQYRLGTKYRTGDGVSSDRRLAAEWLRKAADQNLPIAAFELALLYQQDPALAPSAGEAVRLLTDAANLGLPEAATQLGYCYLKGVGVPADEPQSLIWYRTAAEKGEGTAAYALSVHYFSKRQGSDPSLAEALKWTRIAAEKGHLHAQYNLGVLYEQGVGVTASTLEAAKWYAPAAERGMPEAQYRLGMLYADGKGVPLDYTTAYKWLLLASGNSKESGEALQALQKKTTPQQVAEAESAADAWRSAHPQALRAEPAPEKSGPVKSAASEAKQ